MRRSKRCRWCVWVLCGLAAAGAAGVAGCGGPSETGFSAADPGAKLAATLRAAREGDRGAIPHLIEQLESDDQAVRMYAILALERITGTRKGYVHYGPPDKRRRAVRRWVEAYERGEFDSARRAAAEGGGSSPSVGGKPPAAGSTAER